MRQLVAFIMLFSAQAYACPQLTGSYTCKSQDGSSDSLTLTQTADVNGSTIYSYNGSNMPADNRAYPIPDTANVKSATFRAWCNDDVTLSGQMSGQYFNNGQQFGSITLNLAFSIAGPTLQETTTGQIVNSAGSSFPINQTSICVRDQ